MLGFLWHAATAWAGIALDYVWAALMIAAGFYFAEFFDLAASNPLAFLLRPLRYGGYALIIVGAAFGYGTWREAHAVSDCISAEKLAAVASQRDSLAAEVNGWKQTAALNQAAAEGARKDKERTDALLAQWKERLGKLSKEQRAARAATGDDDRRLCGIVEGRAAGCELRR